MIAIEVVSAPKSFGGTTRNGTTSLPYGEYPTAIRLYDITLRPARRADLPPIVDPPEPASDADFNRLIRRLNDGNDKSGVLVVRELTGEDRVDVWGTYIYTGDSNLAAAAVHAGLLKVGETGWICREVVPTLKSYTGTTRNGVASNSYGKYPIAVKLRRVAGPAPAHRLEPRLGVRQPAEKGWSEPLNQLQARLVLVEEGKNNGTPQVVPYLELRTSESALKVRCGHQHVTFSLVGPDGKERAGNTLPGNGAPTDDAGTVTVPSKSSAKVWMASSGWGIPKDAAAMLTAGSRAWVLEPKDKGKVFLRLTLQGEKIERGADRVPTWRGKIELSVPVTWGEPAQPDAARKLLDTMEGYLKVIPPPKDGMEEHNGPSVPETEPYLLTHLEGVARRLNVTTNRAFMVIVSFG